jgi:hypothetical protein
MKMISKSLLKSVRKGQIKSSEGEFLYELENSYELSPKLNEKILLTAKQCLKEPKLFNVWQQYGGLQCHEFSFADAEKILDEIQQKNWQFLASAAIRFAGPIFMSAIFFAGGKLLAHKFIVLEER